MAFTISTKILSRFPDSPEGWKRFCEIGGLFALAATLIFAGGAWLNSNTISARDAEQKLEFDKALTEAKTALGKQHERAAKAETDLLQLRNEQAPRTIRLTKEVVDRLKLKVGTVLRIEYRHGEREPHRLAERIAEVTRWAQWKVEVTPSEESEIKFPTRSELREGVDIGGGADGLKRDDDAWGKLHKLPKYKAAEELWRFLGANGVEATLHIDEGFWEPDKPIVVKIWPKPLPYSAKAKLGSSLDLFGNPLITREHEERNEAEEKKRVEWSAHLKKEWYPDGEQ